MPEAALSRADLKRGRALLWLILAAALTAAVAVVAVLGDRAAVTATSMNETMFPGFAESSAKAATIRIESPTLYVTLNKGADGKWTVADRSNYPANPEGVRALMLAMSQIKLVERRSADPARHAALELTTGEMGSGHAVTVTAADGSVLAALVAGKVQSRATGSSPGTLFTLDESGTELWSVDGGSDRLVDALVAWGDEDAIAARVADHRAAGADHVCVQVLTADLMGFPLDGWRRLAPALTTG